jgi:hypothetical protein
MVLLELGEVYVLARSAIPLGLAGVFGHCIDGGSLSWKTWSHIIDSALYF